MRIKVLLVDDDPVYLGINKRLLDLEGYAVLTASDGAHAILAAQDSRPDLVLADVDMPGMNGFQLCEILKKDPATAAIPVILISGSYKEDDDLVRGLGGGADDYLVKPVSAKVLGAKIQAVLRRRASPKDLESVLKAGGLSLDVQSRIVTVKGRRVQLTRKEFDLLTTLMRQRGKVVRFNHLLETVWGYDPAVYNDSHTVEVHVSSLRRKLGSPLGKRIANVQGLGYRFED